VDGARRMMSTGQESPDSFLINIPHKRISTILLRECCSLRIASFSCEWSIPFSVHTPPPEFSSENWSESPVPESSTAYFTQYATGLSGTLIMFLWVLLKHKKSQNHTTKNLAHFVSRDPFITQIHYMSRRGQLQSTKLWITDNPAASSIL